MRPKRLFLAVCVFLASAASVRAQRVRLVPAPAAPVAGSAGAAGAGVSLPVSGSLPSGAVLPSPLPFLPPSAVQSPFIQTRDPAAAPRAQAPAASVRPYAPAPAVLTLSGGGALRPEPALTETRAEQALAAMTVPEQGFLLSLPEEGLDLWPRWLNTRMDLAEMDEEGTVRRLIGGLGRSGGEIPWNRVEPVALTGSRLLLLPAGKAASLGLRQGDRILGADVPVPYLASRDVAEMILSGREEAWDALLAYIKERPSHVLDEALNMLPREAHVMRFLDRVLRDETAPQKALDDASRHAPLRWARSLWARDLWRVEVTAGSRRYEVPPALTNSLAAAWRLASLPAVMSGPVVHELGHLLAARLLGLPVSRFRVFPSGNGYVDTPGRVPDGWRGAAVYLAGPLAQMSWGGALLLGAALLLAAGSAVGVLAALAAAAVLRGAVTGSGSTDWPGAARALGFERLALELRHRWRNRGAASYPRMLLRMAREAWGAR